VKEEDCPICGLRQGKKTPKKHMLLYFFYLVPFDLGHQKGQMFSFFVFCPRTIMEFLSVFLSSEDTISGLNKMETEN